MFRLARPILEMLCNSTPRGTASGNTESVKTEGSIYLLPHESKHSV